MYLKLSLVRNVQAILLFSFLDHANSLLSKLLLDWLHVAWLTVGEEHNVVACPSALAKYFCACLSRASCRAHLCQVLGRRHGLGLVGTLTLDLLIHV